MAPMVAEGTQQFAELPVSVAVVSVFGLVFSVSIFAWICCQRKSSKTLKTPPYKFVHMLKGVDIYPEGLSGKKKFAATSSAPVDPLVDVNGNCKPASSPTGGSRTSLHLDLENRDLNGNITKPAHAQKVRSSPDLELPPPTHAGLPPASPCGCPSSSQTPTPAPDQAQEEAPEAGLGTLSFSLDYQLEKKALVVHIRQARGLTPTDEQSLTSDPYIKLTLLPEKKHRVKTRVLRKTLDPAFDETFSFYGIPLARVPELSLHFNVLSFDRFSRDEVIGETLVPLAGVDLSEGRVVMDREIIKRNVRVRDALREFSCLSVLFVILVTVVCLILCMSTIFLTVFVIVGNG